MIEKNSNQFFKKKLLKIINIGRLTDQKDHLTLIKSLNLINKKINFRMLIIGYGINKKFLEKKIKYYNLKKFIKIIDNRHNPFPYLKIRFICPIFKIQVYQMLYLRLKP